MLFHASLAHTHTYYEYVQLIAKLITSVANEYIILM